VYYLLIAPLVALALRTLLHVYSSTLLDFSMYLTATNYFISGHNPYLASAPQVYPPAFLFIMVPFAALPVEIARALWTTLSLVSFFLALHLLLKNVSLKTKVFLGLLVLQLFPVKYALAQGQINFFVFLGFVLLYRFFTQKKDFLAGLTLALITIMKLNPVLLVIYFLVLKKFRLVAYFLALFALLNLIVDLPSAHNLTLSFFQGTLFRSTNPPLYYYNQSLPALLFRLNLSSLSNYVGLLVLFLSTYSFFKNPSQIKKYFALFILTILLISPITWQHYLFWSLPAFFYLLQDSQKPRLLLTILTIVLININIKNPVPYDQVQLVYSHATFGLLLLYYLVITSKPKRALRLGRAK
jgi:hypothetical protein